VQESVWLYENFHLWLQFVQLFGKLAKKVDIEEVEQTHVTKVC
jgi:hypothetical protein